MDTTEEAKNATVLTPEMAREVFIGATRAMTSWFSSKDDRKRMLDILQNSDPNIRNVFATCVNEEIVIKAFIHASFENDLELLQAFYDIGMDVDAKDKDCETALLNVCGGGHREGSFLWLLDHGANVDIQTDQGFTPLMQASEHGKTKVAQMLLEKKANPDLQDSLGRTALIIATRRGFKDIVQLLLDHNVDIDLKTNDGKTALHWANNKDIEELLKNYVNTSFVLK